MEESTVTKSYWLSLALPALLILASCLFIGLTEAWEWGPLARWDAEWKGVAAISSGLAPLATALVAIAGLHSQREQFNRQQKREDANRSQRELHEEAMAFAELMLPSRIEGSEAVMNWASVLRADSLSLVGGSRVAQANHIEHAAWMDNNLALLEKVSLLIGTRAEHWRLGQESTRSAIRMHTIFLENYNRVLFGPAAKNYELLLRHVLDVEHETLARNVQKEIAKVRPYVLSIPQLAIFKAEGDALFRKLTEICEGPEQTIEDLTERWRREN